MTPTLTPTRVREALNLRAIVSRLLQWLRGIQRKPRPPVASPLQPFQPTLSRQWPVGPPYMTLTIRDKNNRAWVEYKLAAAGWYLDALSDLEARTGELSRLVGEEMALDGALVGIASAFDAAVAGLIGAIEVSRGATNLIPVHQYSWQAAKGLARQAPAVTLACATAVDAALLGAIPPLQADGLPRCANFGIESPMKTL